MFSEFSTAKNRTASHKLRDPSNSGLNSGWISNENRVPRYTDTNKEHLVVDARGWRAKRLRYIRYNIYIYIYISEVRYFDVSNLWVRYPRLQRKHKIPYAHVSADTGSQRKPTTRRTPRRVADQTQRPMYCRIQTQKTTISTHTVLAPDQRPIQPGGQHKNPGQTERIPDTASSSLGNNIQAPRDLLRDILGMTLVEVVR